MFSRFKNRRKSMEGQSTAEANRAMEKQQDRPRKSFLDFFKSSRHRKKMHSNGIIANGTTSDRKQEREEKPSHDAQDFAIFTPHDGNAADTAPAGAAQATPAKVLPKETLTEDDVRQLFSGAPHFSIDGQTQPSVSFPWDFELNTRDVRDSKPLPHAAFSGSTLHQHLPIFEASDAHESKSLTYDIGEVEKPSMLASTGNEPGTVGIEFFLQEPEADILNIPNKDQKPEEVFDSFSNFELLESQPEKLGIRKFDFGAVAERLVELSNIYESTAEHERSLSIHNHVSSGELYAALFGKVLIPPKYDGSKTDPTGLKVQIEALIRILNLKRVWYDFSNVEWRIRVGQLIFTHGSPEASDGNLSEPEDGLTERDVILLQLLLACELYTRLEAVARLSTQEVKNELQLIEEEVLNFKSLESRKTKWDLVLARRFLENIDAKTHMKSKQVSQSQQSLTRSLLGIAQRESIITVNELDIVFQPRRQDLQLKGLFNFAEAINWPDSEALRTHLSSALTTTVNVEDQDSTSPSIYATPLSTPGKLTPRLIRGNRESGYFGGAVGSASPEMAPRLFQLTSPSTFNLEASFDTNNGSLKSSIGGWLTRSYLTGLILPGEAICHLLISTILENDADSLVVLGENANLYGGFVYKGRSFWSKSCIVGRVLACLDNSKDCMGWISSTVVPNGCGDGWLDIYSTPIHLKEVDIEGYLEKNTDLLAGNEFDEVKFKELSMPQDRMATSARSIRFEHLHLQAADVPAASRHEDEVPLSTALDFTITEEGEAEAHVIPLIHLVQFVSAWPCTPPNLSATKRSNEFEKMVDVPAAHPLHILYHYRQLHATELLDPKLDIEEGETSSVIVIDARGDCALELIARAWCSSEGLNALIARVGTTCLSCAIREARGLDLKVLIRVGKV
jgi:hypothetical protein